MKMFFANLWLALECAAIVGLLLLGTSLAGQTPPRDDGNVVLSGFLECSNAKDALRECPFKLHYINLVQGKTYDMRMVSSEFDGSLVLEDLRGNQLAQDNEYFEWLDGRIVFRAPTTGSYRLIASSMKPKNEGFYTITIREMPVVANVLAALEPSNSLENQAFCKVYEVPLTAGRRYIIDLESAEFAGFVKLLNAEGIIVAFNDEGGIAGRARIVYEAPRTQMYQIVATSSAAWATGAFSLNVCEE